MCNRPEALERAAAAVGSQDDARLTDDIGTDPAEWAVSDFAVTAAIAPARLGPRLAGALSLAAKPSRERSAA